MSLALPRPLVQWALLLLIIGVGNVWIGYSKRGYYQGAVAKVIEDPEARDSNQERITLKRLESRARYYGFVQWGGVGFVCLAAVLASAALYKARDS